MRKPRVLLVLSVCLAAIVAPGCETAPREGEPTPAYARDIDYGPREDARRPAGLGSDSLFEPMDYATPNERRLGSGAPGPAYWQQRVREEFDNLERAHCPELDELGEVE